MKADQEATVVRLARAARANRLEFLLEIIPSKVAPVTDTTSAEIIQRFYDLGVYPDWWKLEPMKTDAAWANACAAIARNDPHTRGIVVLGLEAPTDELAASFAVAARHDLVKGFAVGRTIFADAARAWLGGAITDARGGRRHGRQIRTPLPHLGRGARAQGSRRMKTIRLTAAQAAFRYLSRQLNEDGQPFLAGCWAIFGHGNVAGIGEALYGIGDDFPTWRGHNEQGMAHAAIAYAKALNRKRAMAVTTSIGPGRAQPRHRLRARPRQPPAGALHAGRRLRQPRPRPGLAAARGLQRRHHDRQRRLPADQPLLRPHHAARAAPDRALPRAFATMTDPAECGPVTLAFCQDVQAEAYDWPAEFFAPKEWHRRRPRPGLREVKVAADAIRGAKKPLIIAGGGVLYAEATAALTELRREAQHPRRRDPGGQVVDALGPPAEPRLDRRHRLGRHQRRRGGGGRHRRGRHPAAGLHHRLVVALPGREPPHRRDQRHALRHPQAQRPAARRRRAPGAGRDLQPPRRLPRPRPRRRRSRPTGSPRSTR